MPNPKYKPSFEIKQEHLIKEEKDPHFRKSEFEIKRLKNEHITEVPIK
jgi:hypothetical protein